MADRKLARNMRRPALDFNVHAVPGTLQPFLCHPVLPGDSLKKLEIRGAFLSDAVADPLRPWFHWVDVFYVRLSDMLTRTQVEQMVTDPTYDSGLDTDTAATPFSFHPALLNPGINWAERATDVVAKHFYRLHDTDDNPADVDGVPPIPYVGRSSHDSLYRPSQVAEDPDVNVDLDADTTITASEVSEALERYYELLSQGMTDLDEADYLRSYGIEPDESKLQVPERLYPRKRALLRPRRLIDPDTGGVVAELTGDVDVAFEGSRFFKEPGFLIAYFCTIPKVLLASDNFARPVASSWENASTWLNGQRLQEAHHTLLGYTAGKGPIIGTANDYVIDMTDVLRYGEQFVTDFGDGPERKLSRYPDTTIAKSWFNVATAYHVRFDGRARAAFSTYLGRDQTAPVAFSYTG